MAAKPPSVCFSAAQIEAANSLDECAKRHHLASIAKMLGPNGVRKVSNYFGTNQKTLYKGIHEIENNHFPPPGRIRWPGGGAKDKLEMHPEWISECEDVLEGHMATTSSRPGTHTKGKRCRKSCQDYYQNWVESECGHER